MNISSMGVTDASVLKLFSEHDDFMISWARIKCITHDITRVKI